LVSIAALLLSACGDDPVTPPATPSIVLTAAQAASLVDRADLLAPAHSDLSWLADSARLVLRTGAKAERITVVVGSEEQHYYAVGLQRAIIGPSNSFATFHLIAFDDPSNPSNWVIANGYNSTISALPPSSVTANYGSQGAFTHLIHVEGSTVTDWTATDGTATLSNGTPGAECSIPKTDGVTCVESTLQASFNVLSASPAGEPTNTRNAALATVTVPGILLRWTP